MAADLSARIGKRVFIPAYGHTPGTSLGSTSKDETIDAPESEAGSYATSNMLQQDSGYDSEPSTRAETPPALLARMEATPPLHAGQNQPVVSPRSLLERVKPRSPVKPISFRASSLASSSGHNHNQSRELPRSGTELIPPTMPQRHSGSPMNLGTLESEGLPPPPNTLGVYPEPKRTIDQATPIEEFEVPGLSATSDQSFLPAAAPSIENDPAIPGLSSSGSRADADLDPASLPPIPRALVRLEDKMNSSLSPVQEAEAVLSAPVTQDQLISRVRDLLTPLILENTLLREKVHEDPLTQKRKELADKTEVALGDDGVCLSFVKNAIDVHVALIRSGKIKSNEASTDPGRQTIVSDGHSEMVFSGINTMPPDANARVVQGHIERFPPLYFSMHDSANAGQSQQSSSGPHPPTSAPRNMRDGSLSMSSPKSADVPPTSSYPSKHDTPTRRYSPSSSSRVSDGSHRRGRSRSRSLPRRESLSQLDQGRFRRRWSRSRSRSRSRRRRRSMSPRQSHATYKSDRRDTGRSSRGRVSPPPLSAPAWFQGRMGASRYSPRRRGHHSTSRSPSRNRRWGSGPLSPPGHREEKYTNKTGRRPTRSPPVRKGSANEARGKRSRSREAARWKEKLRHRQTSTPRSRSRNRGEGPSTLNWRDRRPQSPPRRPPSCGGERENRPNHALSSGASQHWEGERYFSEVSHKYASPFDYDSRSPPPRAESRSNRVPAPPCREGRDLEASARPTANISDAQVKADQLAKPSPLPTADPDDEKEPGQISSSPSKASDIYRSEIPGLSLEDTNTRPVETGVRGIEEGEDLKPNLVELEEQRLRDLKKTSVSNAQTGKQPLVSGGNNASPAQVGLPEMTEGMGQEEDGDSRPGKLSRIGKKRVRGASTQSDQDEDRANRERGKLLEAEREQASKSTHLEAVGTAAKKGLDDGSERAAPQTNAPSVQQGKIDEEEEEGSPVVEVTQPSQFPALCSKPELPCHFVPGVWYIHTGSKIMDTADCRFVIDQETADKWGIPLGVSPETKTKLSVELRCFPTEVFWQRMQILDPDATLGDIARAFAELPQSWPCRQDMPLITLHPGEPNEKAWFPKDMRSSDPSDRSKAIQLENHLVVGLNLLRIIQLSPVPGFTFALYACERSD